MQLGTSMKPRMSHQRSTFAATVAALIVAATVMQPLWIRGEVNEAAKKLVPLITPEKASATADPRDARNLQKRLIKILTYINNSDISGGPRAEELVRNAYEFYLREEMGSYRILMTSTTIVNAWKAARSLGLFDEERKFQTLITKGFSAGEECVFEYIVPPEHAPEFSNDLVNIRIVSNTEARHHRESEELTEAEKNYLEVLQGLKKEAVEGVPVDIGRTVVEAHAEWEREVKEAGEDFKKRPNLIISGNISGTPSLMTEQRWRVSIEVKNISHHPTEAVLHVYIFGISEVENTIYLMAEEEAKIELRRNHVWEGEFFTIEEKKYDKLVRELDYGPKPSKQELRIKQNIELRGWVANLYHDGELVGSDASQNYLRQHLEDLSTMRRVETGKK